MSDCIFCKIVAGEIPSSKIYEDENVVAFLDISQVTKGHTLIIPKQHFENMYDLSTEGAQSLFSVVPKIANGLKETFNPLGMNLVSNTGKEAGQTVFHIHLHLLPRYGKGDGFGAVWKTHEKDYTPENFQEMAKSIRGNIGS